MEFSDDGKFSENMSMGRRRARRRTPVPNTRGEQITNVPDPDKKNKIPGAERPREKTRPTIEKDDENVGKISDNKVKNLQPGEKENHTKESVLVRLNIVITGIAVAVALYPRFVSTQIEPGEFYKLQKFTQELSKRISSIESNLPDITQITARIDDTVNIVEDMQIENRLTKIERNMADRINSNNEELKMFLKDEVEKVKQEVDLKFGDIKEMQKEHKGLLENVTNLGKTLRKQSHIMEEKNSEVSKQMSQHNETLNDLIVSVENHGSSLHSLNVSIENHGSSLRSLNMSVENLSSSLRSLNVSVENLSSSLRSLDVSIENHGSSLRSLNLSVENLSSSLRSLNVSVENNGNSLRSLNLSLGNIDINLRSLNVSLENHSSNIRSLNISVENHDISLRNLNVSVENHGSNLRSLNVSVENHDSNLRSLNVSVENHDISLRNLNVSVENHDISLRNLNVSVENHDSSLRNLNVSVENHDSSLRNLNASVENITCNISGLTISVDSLHNNMTAISIETLVLDKRTGDIKENIFDKWSLTVVIMINTILLVMVIINLVANKHTSRHVSGIADNEQQQANQDPAPYSTAGRILNQVRAHPRLERKLCVISFYEETHPLHMHMTQSVTQQLNMELLELTIRRHENILECPPVSLYFLFVDFNERNVILEDPTLGLGDLRLTTVQAVQKMGGKIVIFYVRDQNSRQLNPRKLYNEDLASVTRQRELSALNRLSRFISAYDQLTEFQKDHLRQIVVRELSSR